jgi:hypothetical protein
MRKLFRQLFYLAVERIEFDKAWKSRKKCRERDEVGVLGHTQVVQHWHAA